jgi:hypothetical protein
VVLRDLHDVHRWCLNDYDDVRWKRLSYMTIDTEGV